MIIEEKLEKLTERHEALAQSVELLRDSVHEQGDNITRILTIVEAQTTNVEATLAMIRIREDRIRRLEGQQ